MNRMLFVALLSIGACAGPSLERVPVPSALPPDRPQPENAPTTGDEAATAAWLEREIARRRGAPQQPQTAAAPVPVGTTNEEATRAWLDRTIEERRTANPSTPPVPMQEIVERTVYVDRGGVGYDQYGQPVYGNSAPANRGTFPVNTALGAGIGAAIGSGSGDCGEGAAIGAGVGLLIDLLSYPW